ncbi:uroporphyrinogen decarboxylase family protein [Methanococcoides vulcani]|uniref:uroporphyrinogen decarboxylase family protein n=1 Tax=Methanococcoides vulcani TaxID=1353158 RepID=UPI002452F267|nr:uroporphyrinogen decarboxylase family protein [Methanococcoides vulcani]
MCLGNDVCLMGNINPNVFGDGSFADIENEVKNCMDAAPEKGFILSTRCEIPLLSQGDYKIRSIDNKSSNTKC